MELEEKYLSRKEIFSGRIIHVVIDTVELPDGTKSTREVAYHPDGVGVLALTDRDEVLLVRQYRYPIEKIIYEIPAGKMDPGETDTEAAAIRELREETGAVAGTFEPFGSCLVSPGFCDETLHLYRAADLQFGQQDLDEDEFLNVERIAFDKALAMVESGEINDAKTCVAILREALHRK